MVNTALFQIIIGVSGFMFLLILFDRVDSTEPGKLESKAIGILMLYTISMFTLLIPATTREYYQVFGILIPPIQVWLEAIIMGFMISLAWDIINIEE